MTCKAALIGMSGFGASHLGALQKLHGENILKFEAVCDVNYEANRPVIDELAQKGIRYYKDYREMLQKEGNLDFVSVSTPIHLHRRMAEDIMEGGFHVLLEKPPAVTIQDIDGIIATSRRTGKACAVNFMLTSDKAFLELKQKIRQGALGKITSITGAGLWKRLDSYYARTPWAGKLVFNGHYVLDGTVNNPLAHLLNNMLFLAEAADAGSVSGVMAELYHGHDIEGEDTSCIRAEMDSGLVLYYYATLCAGTSETPYITVEGTNGRATWNYAGELEMELGGVASRLKYESEDPITNMYRNLAVVLSGKADELYCPVEGTRNFVLASNGAFESSAGTRSIPPQFIRRTPEDGSVATRIEGIESWISEAMAQKKLFSEMGVPWASAGTRFGMKEYKRFNLFQE